MANITSKRNFLFLIKENLKGNKMKINLSKATITFSHDEKDVVNLDV
jgi:hypothetical protein